MLQMEAYADECTNFVLPQYLKAGKFQFVIEYPKGTFYFHKAVVHFRQEEVPLKLLEPAADGGEQQVAANIIFGFFDKQKSVFSGWAEDSEQMLFKCAEHDLRNLDLPLLFQDAKERVEGLGFIERQIKQLKDVFVYVSSESKQSGGIDVETMLWFILEVCKVPDVTEL
jgi:hypothetical protein